MQCLDLILALGPDCNFSNFPTMQTLGSSGDDSSSQVPASYLGDLDCVASSWLHPGSPPNITTCGHFREQTSGIFSVSNKFKNFKKDIEDLNKINQQAHKHIIGTSLCYGVMFEMSLIDIPKCNTEGSHLLGKTMWILNGIEEFTDQ